MTAWLWVESETRVLEVGCWDSTTRKERECPATASRNLASLSRVR